MAETADQARRAARTEPHQEPGLSQEMVTPAAEWLDERFGLDALWLFGSAASNRATSVSDIDLAALFKRSPSAVELLDARGDLSSLLGRTVDLVDLDRASPILVMQVLRHGRLLLDRDPARRIRVVASAPGRYEDLMIVRRESERLLVERVRRGRP
jgi:predicted nucleotidyltransferase